MEHLQCFHGAHRIDSAELAADVALYRKNVKSGYPPSPGAIFFVIARPFIHDVAGSHSVTLV